MNDAKHSAQALKARSARDVMGLLREFHAELQNVQGHLDRVTQACEAALAAPANQAHHVGDTKFEGWLSGHEPDRRDGRTPRYSKQDMRDSYWAGYSEASAAAPVAPRDDDMPTSADERQLRRLLAVRVGIPGAYFDDGEAQGQQHGIRFDFMRDSVADIDAKLRALAVARIECAAPAPVEPVAAKNGGFIVSAVVIKQTPSGFNTQNKLYEIPASSREEAHGKALPMIQADFPEHSLHTICSYRLGPLDDSTNQPPTPALTEKDRAVMLAFGLDCMSAAGSAPMLKEGAPASGELGDQPGGSHEQ